MNAPEPVPCATTCLCIGALLVAVALPAADPQVTNVRAQQVEGSTEVEVLYDLSGAPSEGATVSVAFSATGDGPYGIVPGGAALSGDVGAGVRSGSNRRIVWDAAATLPPETYGTSYRAAVTAVDPGGGGETITITLPGGVPMELVYIPAGTFWMGSPADERGRGDNEDLHEVTLTRGYYLGRTEVTQGQWEAVMGENPASGYGEGDDYPVYRVSWYDICGGSTGVDCLADSFIGRVNAHLGSNLYRLPTEAEWERAARAETRTEFSFPVPAEWDILCGSFPEAEPYMWWCGNNDPFGTNPVQTKQANGYGLHDMHGNLWEWVADWYDGSLGTSSVENPTGPDSGSGRVVRGGGWGSFAQYCRSANRDYSNPGYRGLVGFRLARSE